MELERGMSVVETDPRDSTEEFPAEEREATVLVNVPPETSEFDGLLVTPEQSHDLPQVSILENRRGTGLTPDDIDAIIDRLGRALAQRSGNPSLWRPDGGGRNQHGQWIAEPRFPNAAPIPGRNPMFGGSYADGAYVNTETGELILFQHQSTLKDTETPTSLEKRNTRKLTRNAPLARIIELPKRYKGESDKSYFKRLDARIDRELDRIGIVRKDQ